MNPCLAWARSPTMVKLRDGQRSSSICHSRVGQLLGLVHDDVCERAGELVRARCAAVRSRRTRASCRSWPFSMIIAPSLSYSASSRSSTTRAICSRLAAMAASCRRRRRGRLRVAEPLPGRVQKRQVGHRPRLGVGALQLPHVLGAEPGSAFAQVGRHRPQVADEVSRFEQRPRAVEGREQLPVLPPATSGAGQPVRRRRTCRSGSSSSFAQICSRASLCGVPGRAPRRPRPSRRRSAGCRTTRS